MKKKNSVSDGMTAEWEIGMDLEENGNGLIKVLAHFPQRTNKHTKNWCPC